MAKYDWIALENEYLTGEYKSVSDFLKKNNINRTGTVNQKVKNWKEKRAKKEQKKSKKIIEKTIEKESEKEADRIVNLKELANDLALKIEEAKDELNISLATNKKKTKIVEYDYKANKPKKEIIEENEEIVSYETIIDRKGLKELASALKDLKDILSDDGGDNIPQKRVQIINDLPGCDEDNDN